jgi:hypothetical protein
MLPTACVATGRQFHTQCDVIARANVRTEETPSPKQRNQELKNGLLLLYCQENLCSDCLAGIGSLSSKCLCFFSGVQANRDCAGLLIGL